MKQLSKRRARPWGQKRTAAEKLARKNKRQARIESAPYQMNWQCGPGMIGNAAAREAGDVPGHRCGWVDNPRGLARHTRNKKNTRVIRPTRLYDFMCSAGSTRYAVYATSFGSAAHQLFSKLIGKLKWMKRRPDHDGMGGWQGVSISCLSEVRRRSPFCPECHNNLVCIGHKMDCSQGGASWVEHDYEQQAA